jgi:hypothetical protein
MGEISVWDYNLPGGKILIVSSEQIIAKKK